MSTTTIHVRDHADLRAEMVDIVYGAHNGLEAMGFIEAKIAVDALLSAHAAIVNNLLDGWTFDPTTGDVTAPAADQADAEAFDFADTLALAYSDLQGQAEEVVDAAFAAYRETNGRVLLDDIEQDMVIKLTTGRRQWVRVDDIDEPGVHDNHRNARITYMGGRDIDLTDRIGLYSAGRLGYEVQQPKARKAPKAKAKAGVQLVKRGQNGYYVNVDGTRIGYVQKEVTAIGGGFSFSTDWVAYRVTSDYNGFARVSERGLRKDAVDLLVEIVAAALPGHRRCSVCGQDKPCTPRGYYSTHSRGVDGAACRDREDGGTARRAADEVKSAAAAAPAPAPKPRKSPAMLKITWTDKVKPSTTVTTREGHVNGVRLFTISRTVVGNTGYHLDTTLPVRLNKHCVHSDLASAEKCAAGILHRHVRRLLGDDVTQSDTTQSDTTNRLALLKLLLAGPYTDQNAAEVMAINVLDKASDDVVNAVVHNAVLLLSVARKAQRNRRTSD